jgi:hypothetical protein
MPVVADGAQRFRPRAGHALGLIPAHGSQEVAIGAHLPVVYHGGSVMRNVTIHTIFWTPAGYSFDAPPSGSTLSYVAMLQQFFTDVAAASGSTSNEFSILNQYGDKSGPGSYAIHYSAAADSIVATDPFPNKNHQCASPSGVATCVTDLELQTEIDKIVSKDDPTARGLDNLWVAFLPPNVDECSSSGVCATTAFLAYHSAFDLGHGTTIYAAMPDPQVEFVPGPGGDPEGNPEAEVTIDTVSHETVEAITDPLGNAWMDPNGFEVGDDCENPEDGTPLGYATDGSPYNEVINGHEYLTQMMWSNIGSGCVQRSTSTTSALPLATVDMSQFSPSIKGNIGIAKSGVFVRVGLVRAGVIVSETSTHTRANGSWGPISLGGRHAFGDDRDIVVVAYGRGGPKADVIGTGSGGNPFTESGWTGWFDLDYGYFVGDRGVALGPCSQTGTLTLKVGPITTSPPPIQLCETETNAAIIRTHRITPATRITLTSEDDRAVSPFNFNGALVGLTIKLGEPDSVPALTNDQGVIPQTGFPLCSANLEAQVVDCSGLVIGDRYTLTPSRGHAVAHASADVGGRISVSSLRVARGDAFRLTNSAGRTLTTLHVAHLRVDITGDQSAISGGSCEGGDYYGPPLTSAPVGSQVGTGGVTGTGTICPLDGTAKGLPSATIEQTDDFSGGLTRTVVPDFRSISPNSGATLYGPFVAQAQPFVFGSAGALRGAAATVSLSVTSNGSSHRVLFLRNVAVGSGVRVKSLPAGVYGAKWVLRDRNGDTRTIYSRFVEAK